nr:MAG TPA: hypothetical protein [Caudoviricetes sp.]
MLCHSNIHILSIFRESIRFSLSNQLTTVFWIMLFISCPIFPSIHRKNYSL